MWILFLLLGIFTVLVVALVQLRTSRAIRILIAFLGVWVIFFFIGTLLNFENQTWFISHLDVAKGRNFAGLDLFKGGAAAIFLILVLLSIIIWKGAAKNIPQDEIKSNVAIALGFGAAMSVGLLAVQFAAQGISEKQGYQSARDAVKVAIAVQPDLSGFSVPRDPEHGERSMDLSGYWLRAKKMTDASLPDVQLRGSNLVFTDLGGAVLTRADLTADQNGIKTDLRSASLYWADLTDAKVGNASFFGADMRKTILCGVDLRSANLGNADLREAEVRSKTEGGTCEKPAQLPPREAFPSACWPEDQPAVAGCGSEARGRVCARSGIVAQDPPVRECTNSFG